MVLVVGLNHPFLIISVLCHWIVAPIISAIFSIALRSFFPTTSSTSLVSFTRLFSIYAAFSSSVILFQTSKGSFALSFAENGASSSCDGASNGISANLSSSCASAGVASVLDDSSVLSSACSVEACSSSFCFSA